jgi:GNAT superfamily N-acetyltransferase
MGARGSKPTNQPRTNTRANTRANTTRKNVSKNNRRNQTRVNTKQTITPPTMIYGYPTIDCASYHPPDPERKVPRGDVPHICLEQWEKDIFLQESMQRSRAAAAAPKPPLPLNLTSITWERIKQEAEGSRDTWYPIILFTTPSNEEYAIIDVDAIEDMTQNSKKTYPLRRFFNANKYELMAFCNFVYDSNITRKHIEVEDLTPYLILHKVSTNAGQSIEVVGFMTVGLYDDGIYIGDLCIGPKRGGIGRLTLEEMKRLARDRGLEYVKLEPATNTESFYEKLGFRQSPNNARHHEWHPKNGGRRKV